MAEQKTSNVALCPECDGPLQLSGKPQIGQTLPCHRCGATLMITDHKPLELVVADDEHLGNGQAKVDKKITKQKGRSESTIERIHDQKEKPPMSTISQVWLADCPECTTVLRFHKPLRVGQLVVCHDCDETLEVVSLRPLELHWADEAPWDYEDQDDNRYSSHY